jgi:hypothetical protein
METRMIASQVRIAVAAAGIVPSVGAPMTMAAPTGQVRDGYIVVGILPRFVGALGSLGIARPKVLPGTLHQRIAYFPITGDLGPAPAGQLLEQVPVGLHLLALRVRDELDRPEQDLAELHDVRRRVRVRHAFLA